MANAVDFNLLPTPSIIETVDFEAILAEKKARFIADYPEFAAVIELESEPAVKILQDGAYQEMLLRNRYNQEVRELLLATATGNNLDHIGITYYNGEQRLLVTAGDPDAIPPTEDIYETNDEYRYRLSLQPEGYSTAGPDGAYIYHALSASGQVKDAKPSSTVAAGQVDVYIISRTGDGTASAELINTVAVALNDKMIRPLCDEVNVHSATIVPYQLNVELVLYPGAAAELAINNAESKLALFANAMHRIGGDIDESAIKGVSYASTIKRISILEPAANIYCDDTQAPFCTGITVNVAGVEA